MRTDCTSAYGSAKTLLGFITTCISMENVNLILGMDFLFQMETNSRNLWYPMPIQCFSDLSKDQLDYFATIGPVDKLGHTHLIQSRYTLAMQN